MGPVVADMTRRVAAVRVPLGYAAGAIALTVEPPARRLTVAIDAPATNRPQAKMTAKLSVRDENGKPVSGEPNGATMHCFSNRVFPGRESRTKLLGQTIN